MIRIMRPALEPLSYRAARQSGQLVGPAGLEPTASRVSDECSHPVSYEPAEDGGVDPRGLDDRHGLSGPVAAPAAHLPDDSTRNEEVPTPTARTAIRFRSGARHPAGSRSRGCSPPVRTGGRCRRTEIRIHLIAPPGSRRGRRAWPVHPSTRGERATRTPRRLTAQSLSGDAQHPGRFTLHGSAWRESNPHASRHWLLGPACLPEFHHKRMRAADRIRTGDPLRGMETL